MAVYTAVPFEAAADLVTRLNIGTLTTLEGCKGGIENTNYFADTTRARYVLTLFERLGAEQLPFYLRLMQHLAARGILVVFFSIHSKIQSATCRLFVSIIIICVLPRTPFS